MGMRFRPLMIAAALAGAVALPGSAQAQTGCNGAELVPGPENVTAVRTATLCLVNQERSERDLVALKAQASLQSVASNYARQMVDQRFFEHTSPDGSTLVDRIERTRYLSGSLRQWTVGENIAWGSGVLATPRQIVEAWMGSPGHRRNILDKRYRELGLGVALGAPRAGVEGPAATYVNNFGLRRR